MAGSNKRCVVCGHTKTLHHFSYIGGEIQTRTYSDTCAACESPFMQLWKPLISGRAFSGETAHGN